MKKFVLLLALSLASTIAAADEVTWTCVNFAHSSFSATAAELQFSNCVNVLVTNNTNGKSVMLLAADSGNTGAATSFVTGPPLEADYAGSGAGSALVASGSTTFLSGTMLDGGRLEANYPNAAGGFLSRFHVDSVDSAILLELGTTTTFEPDGSVSLTLAETSFDGTTLHATLGGAEYTITTTTTAVVPESERLGLAGTGLLGMIVLYRRYRESKQ